MNFPTYITLSTDISDNLPEEYDFQDVRYTPELIQYLLNRFSETGDTVLDPFAGFGTTLIQARAMGRQTYGIEIDDDKINYMRKYHGLDDNLIHGDIRRLYLDKILPIIDLVVTSPPYMGREDSANALTGYRYAGDYQTYLDQLVEIFKSIRPLLAADAYVLVEISNLKQEQSITTLAWDVGKRLADVLIFEGEIIINWTGDRDTSPDGTYNYGYDHSYCLVYTSDRSRL